MSLLLAAPIVIPMTAGALSLLVLRSGPAQRVIAVVACLALLASGIALGMTVWTEGVTVLYAGDWPAPYGIVLAADLLSVTMVLMTGLTGLAAAIYSGSSIEGDLEHAGYYPLMHLVLAGVAGAFLTGDIFNLYVWFEVLLLASFALLAMGGERAQMAGALQYVVLNLVSSALFLTATGLLYAVVGTLNMADLSVKLANVSEPGRVTVIASMFLVAFSIKAAAFPLYFWLPASYHTPPVAISALFAGLLTKVGVYALYRCFTLVFTQDVAYTHLLLKWAAGTTMIAGALGALAQTELRRVLSFQHIGQIGYMLLGLALYTPLAIAAGVFYVVHHIVMMSNLFLFSGIVQRLGGTQALGGLGGLWRERPSLAVLFLVPALSLAGIPPLSGFWGKFLVVQAAILEQAWWLVAAALTASVLTLYSVITVWNEVFWKAAPASPVFTPRPVSVAMLGVVVVLAAITLSIGLAPQPLLGFAERASAQLLDTEAYRTAVLGPAGAP